MDRKCILSLLTLMLVAITAFADGVYFNYTPGSYSFSMTLTVKLVDSNGLEAGTSKDYVGAFIGDECRGEAAAQMDVAGNNVFSIKVYGNAADAGKQVTLRLRQHDWNYTDIEAIGYYFDIPVSAMPSNITFRRNQNYGSVSSPLNVTFQPPVSWWFTERGIDVEVGQVVDLRSYLDYSPANCAMPEWKWTVGDYGTLNGSVFIPSRTGQTTASVSPLMSGSHSAATIEIFISPSSVITLEGLTIMSTESPIKMAVGSKNVLDIMPTPNNFAIDPTKLVLSFERTDEYPWPATWSYMEQTTVEKDEKENYYHVGIDCNSLGEGILHLSYDGTEYASVPVSGIQHTNYTDGWQWVTPFAGRYTVNGLGEEFCEVRSDRDFLFKDPTTFKVYGSLTELAVNQTYKMKISKIFSLNVQMEGTNYGYWLKNRPGYLHAVYGWQTPSYQFYHRLDEPGLIYNTSELEPGWTIKTRDAYATWDGTRWTGTLEYLTPGEGIIVCNTNNNMIYFAAETKLEQHVAPPTSSRKQSSPSDRVLDPQPGNDMVLNSALQQAAIPTVTAQDGVGLASYNQYINTSNYEASSLYFIRLTVDGVDQITYANGQARRNNGHPAIVGAYVNGELRGISQVTGTSYNTIRQLWDDPVLCIRVWGNSTDPGEVTFCATEGYLSTGPNINVEYELLTTSFGCGQEATYGTPSAPIELNLKLPTSYNLSGSTPQTFHLAPGETRLISYSLLPDDCSPVSQWSPNEYVTFTSLDESVFTVDKHGLITAVSYGQAQLMIQNVSSSKNVIYLNVTVEEAQVSVTGIRNDEKDERGNETLDITKYFGDEFKLNYTVLPENASNRAVDISIEDPTILRCSVDEESGDYVFTSIGIGSADVVVETQEGGYSLTYHVHIIREEVDPVTLTFPAEITLSKLRDTTVQFTKDPESATVKSKLISFEFEDSPNAGWGPVATAKVTLRDPLAWILRGAYAGTYTVRISYNGDPVLNAQGNNEYTVHIPVEIPLSQGWNWLSFYAINATGYVPLKSDDSWLPPMLVGSESRVEEIRSQTGLLQYDPKYGFFGSIDRLSTAEGMYKINARVNIDYDDEGNLLADDTHAMVFNLGYDNLLFGDDVDIPKIHRGYTWMAYTHELDHSLEVLSPYLSGSAAAGDMIIGQMGFVEFDGNNWYGTPDFTFQAGHGYIYYTERDDAEYVDWGSCTLGPDPVPADSRHSRVAARSPWQYEPRRYAECMPVVTRIEGLHSPTGYTLAAFVDDECRGWGEVSADGLFRLAVEGSMKESVTFRLYNHGIGEYYAVEPSLSFAQRAGSFRDPVVLNLTTESDELLKISFPSDGTVFVGGGAQHPCITVTDMQGRILTQQKCWQLSLRQWPAGIYVITVTDGNSRVVKKVALK